jgi:hypothetical protein
MATNATAQQVPETEKKKRQRSPNYPTVGLKEAIERTKKFYDTDGKAGASPEMAAKHIGYSTAHGEAYSVLSALKKFGLVEDKTGRMVPTARAIEILSLPANDPRRLGAIRKAAVAPPIYAELLKDYRDTGLPADDTLEGELIAYKGFNPNAVKLFLRSFKETLEFAGLSDFSVLGSELKVDEGEKTPQIGDYVQWEHNGILGLPQSKKLLRFSEDGQFGFVEGASTGLPVSEIIPSNPPEQSIPFAPHAIAAATAAASATFGNKNKSQGAKMRQDVFSLAEGEAVIHWPTPLSPDSIADLEEWLDLVKRKIKRSTAEPEKDSLETWKKL